MKPLPTVLLAAAVLPFAGCTLGPNYERPAMVVPADYRWKPAEPRDGESKGPWWELYADAELDRLQAEALNGSQTLKGALARVEQARARARVSRADFFPTLTASPAWQRYRTSETTAPSGGFRTESITANEFNLPIDLSYEIDLWGKVRRAFESNRAELLASAAAYQQVLFTLQADVASTYFRLRAEDLEIGILEQTVLLRQDSLRIFQQRFESGLTSELDASRARTELASAQAELAATRRRRADLESTLAVLCGRPAATFRLERAAAAPLLPPEIAPGLPSALLERRPDIAEAERRLAARNAEIGVALAAFFPSLRLTAGGGLQSAELADLFQWESRIWSFGPQITVPILAGGRNKAALEEARAAHEEAVATYRQTVLNAFQEVDDALSALRYLTEQAAALDQAAAAARKSAELSTTRYRNGVVDYLEVIDAERSRLETELQSVRIAGERMNASILLVKAIGGGWPAVPPGTAPDAAVLTTQKTP
jgi:multidrug efflux system outer membrane protein